MCHIQYVSCDSHKILDDDEFHQSIKASKIAPLEWKRRREGGHSHSLKLGKDFLLMIVQVVTAYYLMLFFSSEQPK